MLSTTAPVIFAQDAPAGNPLINLAPILLLVFMFFIMMRSQKRQAREQQEKLAKLKSGDEVIAAGGIHGLITNVSDKTITLKIADNVKIKLEKSSVITVTSPSTDSTETAAA